MKSKHKSSLSQAFLMGWSGNQSGLLFQWVEMGAALWSAGSSHTSLSLFINDFLLCWNKTSVVAGPSLQRCGFSAHDIDCLVLCYRFEGRTFPRGRPESLSCLCCLSAGTVHVVALHRVHAPLSALQHERLIFKTDVTGWIIVFFFLFSLTFFVIFVLSTLSDWARFSI